MNRRRQLLLGWLLIGMTIPVETWAGFILVDGFEAQAPGPIHGQMGWTSLEAVVTQEPGNSDNQVLMLDRPDAEAFRSLAMPSANPGTLFFRLRVEVDNAVSIMPVLNWMAGLSGGAISQLPSPVEPGLRLLQNRNPDNYYPKALQVLDRDQYAALADLYPQIWYNVWVVTRPQDNTCQLYLEGGQFPVTTRLTDITGKTDFSLPPGESVAQMLRFHVRTGSDHAAPIYLDDIYVDLAGENLTQPPPAPVNPRLEALKPSDGTRFYAAADGLSVVISTTSTNQIASTNISLRLNGVDVSASLQIGGTASRRTVAFAGLESHTLYTAQLAATDDLGRQTQYTFVFDTFIASASILVEAEHYNFQGGQFINAPVLSQTPGPNNYLQQIALDGIDVYSLPSQRAHVYRSQDGLGTLVSDDAPRSEYATAGIEEIDLGPFEFGEWANYSRTVPTNYYLVYARVAGAPGLPVSAQLDLVTSATGQTNQSSQSLGLFATGPIPNTNYFYVPLADGLGSPIAIRVEGTTTWRITARASGFRVNYLLLVPSTSSAPRTPFLSFVYPRPSAMGVMPDDTLELVLTDRDSQVDTNSLQLRLDARDVSHLMTVARSANTTTIRYRPTDFWAAGSSHRITFGYGDTAQPPQKITNSWWFTITTNLVTLPAEFALPTGNGRSPGFTLRTIQAAAAPVLPDTIERAEYQLARLYAFNGLPVLPETQSLAQTPMVNFVAATNPSASSATAGHFTNDYVWPRLTNHANNIAVETVTYLALNRGSYRFAVHGDDSFRLTSGPVPHDVAFFVGLFEGTRPATDTVFDVLVLTNGVYPFRLVWEQATGQGCLEWFTVDPKTYTRTLLNDTLAGSPIAAFSYAVGLTNPIRIAESPTNTACAVNQQATFGVSIAGAVDYWMSAFYQWQSNQVDIIGANSSVYTTPKLSMDADGSRYRCQVTLPGYRLLNSEEALLTVVNDTNPPTIVQVQGSSRFRKVLLTFSEPLNEASAEDPSHYRFTSGLAVLGASLDPNGTNVYLTTTLQQENTRYDLIVNGVTDVWGLAIAAETKIQFTSFVLANGFLTREIYEDLPGTDVASLTDSEDYQAERYDRLAAMTSFESPFQDGAFYGQRVWGYLTAPESGDYVFRLSAADSAELWLSKDEVMTNTALIARVLVPTRPLQWTNDFYQTSGAITLQAGQAYYVEVLHKAGATNDHVEVAWTPPSRSGSVNAIEIIPGDYLATYVNPDVATITITQQPTNVTVPEFRTATFSVVATGSSYLGTNVIYQWLRDGASIPGAKSAVYRTPPVKAADNQSRFQCIVSVPGRTVYSEEAVLTVIEPIDLPELRIAREAANAVISWISTATNLVLESQTNLVATNWVAAPEPVIRNGDTNLVATPVHDQDSRFFRLRSP